MKVVTLINLGAATRVVHDAKHRPVVIEIGERAESIEIHDKVYELLNRGQHNDTLLIIDPSKFELPEKMKLVLDLIRRLDDGFESELLNSYGRIFGTAEAHKRPSRQTMLVNLLKLSRSFCRFTLNKERADSTVSGDPLTTEVNVEVDSQTQPEPPVTPAPTAQKNPGRNRRHRR